MTRSGVIHVNVKLTYGYSCVADELAQHEELSLTAIGLGTHILSLRDGEAVDIRSLAGRFPEGEIRIASALRELEEYGYLHRFREKLPNGKIVSRTVFYNHPDAYWNAIAGLGDEIDGEGDGEPESEPESEPETDLESEPEPEPESESESESDLSPEEQRFLEAALDVAAQGPAWPLRARLVPQPRTGPAPAAKSAPEARWDPEWEPEPGVEAVPAAERPRTPAAEPGSEPDADPALDADPYSDPGPDADPDAGPEPDPDPDPEPPSGGRAPARKGAPRAGRRTYTSGARPKRQAPDIPPPSGPAAELLMSLRRYDPRLLLSARDVHKLVPGVNAWFARGAHPDGVRHTLTALLPDRLAYPAGLLAYRLKTMLPPPLPVPARAAGPIPLQNCDSCDRAFRSPHPGKCGGCRSQGEQRTAA
ncbi:hypothetical protein ACGFRB_18425 [Streptomyces sp. NPDC048718]|uniref:hypothetical protein n=1 Tax=Streptomyces sp. NPDC048718 TaxID=3365587 RepID=UPI0037196994